MTLEQSLGRRLIRVLGARQVQRRGQDVVAWAELVLSRHDSVSLAILAGLTPPWDEEEVERYLIRAAGELGFQLPSAEVLSERYAAIIAEDLLDGRLTAAEGCRELYRLCMALQCPGWLSAWIGLEDALSMAELAGWSEAGDVAQVEQEIRAEACRLLAH